MNFNIYIIIINKYYITYMRYRTPIITDNLQEEPASFPRGLIQISMVVAHSPRPPPWPRNLDIIRKSRTDSFFLFVFMNLHLVM